MKLNEIATITDGFNETPSMVRFNGKPCVMVQVSRVGDQDSVRIAETIKDFLRWRGEVSSSRREPSSLLGGHLGDRGRPSGHSKKQRDLWALFWSSLSSPFSSGPSLAFWIAMGIPVSLMGAIGLMPYLGVTVNLISLFGFILVLGIVVDDAIVTGENIYHNFSIQPDTETAAIVGAREVAVPVIFGVLDHHRGFRAHAHGGGRGREDVRTHSSRGDSGSHFLADRIEAHSAAHLKHLRTHRSTNR